ncbi:retinol-binding protein pinta-like [Condylostylus longicornis]|uniref:retinol-binding protein pinta-like n=1 Tax=Condylostylus longicornis TaxID=2530218 RepID=UPI00244DF69F|nr:retinol-binding protein pinta-like [Condylostylus longicornis]
MSSLRELSPVLIKIAKEELNEVPNRLKDDIKNLKIWAEKQKNFKSRISDQFLVAFLRGCKHSLERSKEKLERYYLLKANLEELYTNRRSDDPILLNILKQGIVLPLIKPHGEGGPIVHIIRPGSYDPNKIKFSDIIKVGTIIADIYLIENDNAVVSGLIEVLDLGNVSAQHLFHIDVAFVKKFATYYENGMPIRQKGFYFINTPTGFETLYNIFKPLISSKNKDRVVIAQGSKEIALHPYILKDILPEEYGGNGGSAEDINNYWITKFLEYKDYFIEEDCYVMEEKFKNSTFESCKMTNFGIDGSFRKIEFD